jgi:acyl dehydratase
LAETSILNEEMKNKLGIEIGPQVYEIERCMIRKYAAAIESSNPLWCDEQYAKNTQYGTLVTPPSFLMDVCHLCEQEDWVMAVGQPGVKLLNGSMEQENYQVVKAGDTIYVTGKLVELNERESKKLGKMLVMVLERTFKNQRGEIVAKGRFNFIKY